MFTKTNLISTIVAAVWSFMGGYLLWGILGDSFLTDHLGSATGVMKEMPEFGILALGCLIQGFAFSSIFRNWGVDKFNAMDGLKYGTLVGMLTGFGNGVIDYATSNMLDLTGAIVNGFIYIVFFAIMGLLVGLIYQKVR